MKKIKDFIIGQYYYCELKADKTFFITKCNGYFDDSKLIGYFISKMCSKNFQFLYSTPCVLNDDRITRKATQKEKIWLDACIKANKFISYKNVKFIENFEIY